MPFRVLRVVYQAAAQRCCTVVQPRPVPSVPVRCCCDTTFLRCQLADWYCAADFGLPFFLLRILRGHAARSRLHSSCMMIRRIGRCFSCRWRCIALRCCHMTRRTSGAGRHRCFSCRIRLSAIYRRHCLRKCARHLFRGRLYGIRLCRGSLRGNSFLTGYGIRAALLRRRAAMIAVCIRGRIDVGSAASTASARAGRCIRLGVPADAARLMAIFADGMRCIGHH